MTRVVVPVRYPLSKHSRATLESAIDIAKDRDAALTVLHVNLYQNGKRVSRADLKRATERAFGTVPYARYVVRRGFLVEETILDEVAAEEADVVVIGSKQVGRWRRMLQKVVDEPDIDDYLRRNLDCEVVTVEAE
ncbi:universal stress protein [Haloarchaeobius baliensis]|uniref:universal stress protein n=1 Tax=Haloarchaeobius baliensis TaxID=1670458 RepID=UPI003F884375